VITNLLAVIGCAEFAVQELESIEFDHMCLAVGTGGTLAGLVCGFKGKRNIIGLSILKQGDFLTEDIRRLVIEFSDTEYSNWSLLTGYHHGGYAKTTPQLEGFISEMNTVHGLPLDHVYTGKVLWALLKEVEAGAFKRGDTIMMIHTGGLQGGIIDAPSKGLTIP
jgi:1-aminocyclopropane-1-carboxylate deaminase